MLVALLAPASYVFGAELLGHCCGVVIWDVFCGDSGGRGMHLWGWAEIVGPEPSFGACGWSPERQGGCECGLFVGVCLVPWCWVAG